MQGTDKSLQGCCTIDNSKMMSLGGRVLSCWTRAPTNQSEHFANGRLDAIAVGHVEHNSVRERISVSSLYPSEYEHSQQKRLKSNADI